MTNIFRPVLKCLKPGFTGLIKELGKMLSKTYTATIIVSIDFNMPESLPSL